MLFHAILVLFSLWSIYLAIRELIEKKRFVLLVVFIAFIWPLVFLYYSFLCNTIAALGLHHDFFNRISCAPKSIVLIYRSSWKDPYLLFFCSLGILLYLVPNYISILHKELKKCN